METSVLSAPGLSPHKINRDMDELNTLLRAWKLDVPACPTFRRDVWTRIAASEAQRTPTVTKWVDRLLSFINKPAIAAAALLMAIILGSAIGQRLFRNNGMDAYLQTNNPFVQVQSKI